ncbi:MAG: hypothetical protein M3040_01340 [Bacteroidota bacterium]|nr:hypothetical protein [Bacteroidota bacterium]
MFLVSFIYVWIELLIPVSIIIAEASSLSKVCLQTWVSHLILTLFFGLVREIELLNYSSSATHLQHGYQGKSNARCSIHSAAYFCVNIFKVNRREYILFLGGAVLALAIQKPVQRPPF